MTLADVYRNMLCTIWFRLYIGYVVLLGLLVVGFILSAIREIRK